MKQLRHLPLILIFLIGIVFSFKSLREPDLWWQIRTGEWILEHGQVPKTDVFSYTFSGSRWVNVKWGTEVLYALITRAMGPECVFLLQALLIVLLLYFLLKIAQLYEPDERINTPVSQVALWCTLLFVLLAAEYRINGRPEMFSHLFTVVFLYLLLCDRRHPSKYVLLLIPLQALWANLHEAFGIGIVLCGIYCAADWISFFWAKRKRVNNPTAIPKRSSLLLCGVIASVVLNPNGLTLLTKPLNILGQVYANKYTTELFDFRNPDYWQWNVFFTLGLLVIGLIGCAFPYFLQKKKMKKSLRLFEEWKFAYLLALLAFAYLASTAFRNVIFLVLVFFPMLYVGLRNIFQKLNRGKRLITTLQILIAMILVVLYSSIVTNKYYLWTKSRDHFGLEVLSTENPVGAADFIRSHQWKGSCFSDYLTSSYLLWALQPDFRTFIDLRDLDIFPPDFFNTFAEAVTYPDAFVHLDSTYHFSYVTLYRPQFAALHQYLYHDSLYRLSYVDAVAAVFQKVKNHDTTTTVFSPCRPVSESSVAAIFNRVLNPFYQPFDYSHINLDYLAASYFIQVGDLARAEQYALTAAMSANENDKGKEILGEVYYNEALRRTSESEKDSLLTLAGNYYRQSLQVNPNFAPAYLGMGAVYFQQQNYVLALASFEKCIRQDASNLNAYLFAAECCKFFINQNQSESVHYTKKAIAFYQHADRLNQDNPTILLNLGFLYYRLGDCDNCIGYLSRVVGYQGLSPTEKQQVVNCLRQCGK